MDQLLYRYLSACRDSPFGFFEVIGADPGRGMQMREKLTMGWSLSGEGAIY